MNQESLPSIIPVSLGNDSSKLSAQNQPIKPKLACQLEVGEADLRVYNGISQYILTTIVRELTNGSN
ncbi:hypothetical protein ACWN8B_10150 [Vagococcus zengguangii]|uniref:Uncharacterized protein n=1 Tax=Vagococcus zengguangii TaxID=2571750 RepID=A0A4D7CSZ8_9ENTE|nr:hypothetical protein [Vagococcus zengguangii]QCI86283.1 hypothetical protein FA707_04580 [Vagococcus zengguangii]